MGEKALRKPIGYFVIARTTHFLLNAAAIQKLIHNKMSQAISDLQANLAELCTHENGVVIGRCCRIAF